MKITISDLLFPGFTKFQLRNLDKEYGIEFFYEFGKDYYWNEELEYWGERSLSIHGPCVAINLADPVHVDYARIFSKTFAYAKKCGAEFVVVHTNELWSGEKEAVQEIVIKRLDDIMLLAEKYGVKMVIENVGLRTKNSVLFDCQEFVNLFHRFPKAGALLDVGHAHVNGWDLAATVCALKEHLVACHIHDNDGNGDAHLPVGQGNVDWYAYFEAVKQYASNAVQVMEYSCGFADTTSLKIHLEELKKKYAL